MSFYCNSSIESIQSCACSCRTSCCYPCRPCCCCCCKKQDSKPLFKRRSRFGDIFKGQGPNLEDLNYYRNKKKSRKTNEIDGKGGRKKKKASKGAKANGKKGKGGKGTRRNKKKAKGTRPAGASQDLLVAVGGDYDGRKFEEVDGTGPGRGNKGAGYGGAGKGGALKDGAAAGGAGGAAGGAGATAGGALAAAGGPAGAGNAGIGAAGYASPGTDETGYAGDGHTGTVAAGYAGTVYEELGHGAAGYVKTGTAGYNGNVVDGTGYGGGKGQGWSAGDGGAYRTNKYNECRPNQLVKCPQKCTLRAKKCMPNQLKPCHEACMKGIPYNETTTSHFPAVNFGNQPLMNADGGLYCAHGGLQRNYGQTQNIPFNFIDQNKPWASQPAPLQTALSCPIYQNIQDIPQYCNPYVPTPFYPGDQNFKNMQTYCGPQNQAAGFNSVQNFGYCPPNASQYCSPQVHNGYGTIPYNMQPSQYDVNPLGMICQRGAVYTNNPFYQQQIPVISTNYGWPSHSTTSPQMISEYRQGRDGNQTLCPAVRSVTCKLCGRERKFVQTLYIKPNVDTIFTTKDVKTKCSQTIA